MADCDTIINKFIAESGRISPTLWTRKAATGPWFNAIDKGAWPDGMGTIINSLLWERTVSTENGDEWSDVAVSNGSTKDNCLDTPEILNWGQTSRSMRLQRRYFQTPEFCVEDLRFDFQIAQYLNSLLNNLSWLTKYVWDNRNRHEYIRLSDHKITETGNVFDINTSAFDAANPPTSRLLNGTLERVYQRLLMEGADGVGTTSGGRPIFALYTDDVTSRDLIRQDPDLREDFRFAYEGMGDKAPTMGALGTPFSYNGFKHIYDPYPERFDIVNGAYVRRQPFGGEIATTIGTKRDVDPVYMYAAYQITPVVVKNVYRVLLPKPISSLGNFKFDPVNYLGDFTFKNIPDKKCNPKGTKIFLDATFESASEPGITQNAWSIIHRNCPPIRTPETSCYS